MKRKTAWGVLWLLLSAWASFGAQQKTEQKPWLISPVVLYCTEENFEAVLAMARKYAPPAAARHEHRALEADDDAPRPKAARAWPPSWRNAGRSSRTVSP